MKSNNIIDQYESEAKERRGGTGAWKEYERKRSSSDGKAAFEGLTAMFAEIGKLKDLPPDDPVVQSRIAALQQYITDHFYTCTDEIFAGLGEMYSADPRFKENIDRAGGPGTAEFTSKAIGYYCKNR